jgi:hypothetical protein
MVALLLQLVFDRFPIIQPQQTQIVFPSRRDSTGTAIGPTDERRGVGGGGVGASGDEG